jgi:hypothetical protein
MARLWQHGADPVRDPSEGGAVSPVGGAVSPVGTTIVAETPRPTRASAVRKGGARAPSSRARRNVRVSLGAHAARIPR